MNQGVMLVCLHCLDGTFGGLEGFKERDCDWKLGCESPSQGQNRGKRWESVNLPPPLVNSMKVPLNKACTPNRLAVSSTNCGCIDISNKVDVYKANIGAEP